MILRRKIWLGLLLATVMSSAAMAELTEQRMVDLMTAGRRALTADDYQSAIRNYTLVLREGDTPYAPDALEYLGVARERNGQQGHAISEYRRYLATYPQAENALRVQQRLDGLLLAVNPTDPAPNAAPEPVTLASPGEWSFYGGISQYYRRDEADFGSQGTQTLQSAVLTDLDLLSRYQGSRFDFEARATLSNYYDLQSDVRGVESDTRYYYLYADLEDRETGLSGRLGRQTLNTSGVLGRFDGAHLAWQFAPDWRVNFITGEPVYSTRRSDDSDRSFVGVSVDRFDIADLFDLSVYYNEQEIDGITDRQAVGAEVRYYGDRQMLVSYVDYDIGYNVLNNVVALGNWSFDSELTLNASIDYRRTPFLLTENALVGQDAATIDELREQFSEGEIRRLAEQRTGELTSVTLGFSRPLSDRIDINADVTRSDFTGFEGELDPAAEYYYSLSFVGSGFMREGSTSIVNFRYYDGEVSTVTSASVETRLPITNRFRFNPRLLMSYRESSNSDATELLTIPALRLFYRAHPRVRLEFDAGWRLSNLDSQAGSDSRNSWYVYTGYRADF